MKIIYISTYPPKQCGIATFNQSLLFAISKNFEETNTPLTYEVIAMDDADEPDEGAYPEEVKFILRKEHQEDYIQAANYINNSEADCCILQHEFGIFGGQSGMYVLPLIHHLKKPLICVLHTILKEPSYIQKIITAAMADQCEKLVVMSKKAIQFLKTSYNISAKKIQLIEHGVPDIEPAENNPFKELTVFKNRKVLLTFGLISKNKGIEVVIRALPKIAHKFPEVMYVVLGNTHPGILKNSGEEYRNRIKLLATELHVENHLAFINHFVSEEDLVNYLSAAHMYITPYLNEAQITSGTLSYAVGAGAAVVSTPYWHAQELLADGRGLLFNFKDSEGLGNIIIDLFEHPDKLKMLKQNAYNYGKQLRWPYIGKKYIRVLEEAINLRLPDKKKQRIIDIELMPEFSLTHVLRLTDKTGIAQHARFGIPNLKEGYCLDDNSRALIMILMAYQQHKSSTAFELLSVYLSFINYMQLPSGNFHNFLSFKGEYLDETGSEDSFGRTIWSLGFLIHNSPNNSYREFAEEIFNHSIQHFTTLKYIRGFANTIIGTCYYLKAHPYHEEGLQTLTKMTEAMLTAYYKHSDHNWQWFENTMTYDNAILPLALLHAYQITGEEEVKQVALTTLDFLSQVTLRDSYFSPVGNNGWYAREGKMPVFDQQAIETMSMVLLYYQAFEVTQQTDYLRKMFTTYLWFLGENVLRVPLYDHETAGCCDGLQSGSINRNQGAESTLAYLIAHLTVLKAFEQEYFADNTIKKLQPA